MEADKKTNTVSIKNTRRTEKDQAFYETLHRSGRMFTLICLVLICLMPVVFCVATQTMPNWKAILTAVPFTITYLLIALIEVISYAPLLGVGGHYMAFITGNISNLKLPCSINAQTIAKTVRGSEEQEVVSTIAIAISSITTTLIIAIGLIPLAIYGNEIVSVLKPLSPYVIPAIFGGLGLVLLAMYFKLTMIPLTVMLVVSLVMFLIDSATSQSVMLTVGMFVSLISGFIQYRQGKKKEEKVKFEADDLYAEEEDDMAEYNPY
ncbi:MAG: hypothetical protein LBU04_05920 [Christensenellaceae bacterium]|jgi:hypothetical protein|nr:hypothetical protein [Christensenellaceae bacterium]